MTTVLRPYTPEDFIPIRDFLVRNYCAFPIPVNWALTRWNYTRYLCAPMLGAWGVEDEYNPVPDTSGKGSAAAVALWESVIGVWEDSRDGIVGVVCPDEYVPWHPAYGQAFLQRHPDHEHLIPEMLAYAERTLAHNGRVRIYVGELDTVLQRAAAKRGYVRDERPCLNYMEMDLDHLPEPALPPGYRFMSMAECDDLEKRRKIGGLTFRHTDPNDWPIRLSYESLATAPDYRKDLDLLVVRPDGEFVACTVGWFDEYNRLATVEPLGSIQLGMGREVLMEALRRMAAMGAVTAHMDAALKFYQTVGFKVRFQGYRWVKENS